MARMAWLHRSYEVLGGRLPAPVALLIGATFATSIVGAQWPQIAMAGALVPGLVLQGELWRLFTFVLFEGSPIGLVFSALGLFVFGRELVRVWGPGRFLGTYFAIAGASGLVTCLLAFPFPSVGSALYLGPWPLLGALTIAFAIYSPDRDIFLYMVLPLRGRNLIYATLGLTLLFALLYKFLFVVPHFAAELGTLAWLRGLTSPTWWGKIKYEIAYRSWRRRASKLKAVPTPPREEPPRYYH